MLGQRRVKGNLCVNKILGQTSDLNTLLRYQSFFFHPPSPPPPEIDVQFTVLACHLEPMTTLTMHHLKENSNNFVLACYINLKFQKKYKLINKIKLAYQAFMP